MKDEYSRRFRRRKKGANAMDAGPHAGESASPSSLGARARGFVRRVIGTMVVAVSFLALIHFQTDEVQKKHFLEHPLVVAMDEVGASLRFVDLVVSAVVDRTDVPTMATLKRLARRVALQEGEGVNLWSAVRTGYYAIYYEGPDPLGGRWIASARYVSASDPGDGHQGDGRIEVSLKRALNGRPESVQAVVDSMKGRVRRTAGISSGDVRVDVHVQARPPESSESGQWMAAFMNAAGVASFVHHEGDAREYARGYSPLIADATVVNDRHANVYIQVSHRGQQRWIDAGSPSMPTAISLAP